MAAGIQIRLELLARNLPAALQALHEIESLVQQQEDLYYHSWVETLRVYFWLVEGNVAEASEWGRHIILPQESWGPMHFQICKTLLRVYPAQARYEMVIQTIEHFQRQLDRPETNRNLTIEYLSFYVVALQKSGKEQQAHSVAARLLALSEQGGYISIYLEAGNTMREVLTELLKASQEGTFPSPLPHTYLTQLLKAFITPMEQRHVSQGTKQPPTSGEMRHLEPLTSQEQRVLRLLATGRTYDEMARALIVSRNTIKTQVSSIYRKFGVSRRTEAIELARHHLLL